MLSARWVEFVGECLWIRTHIFLVYFLTCGAMKSEVRGHIVLVTGTRSSDLSMIESKWMFWEGEEFFQITFFMIASLQNTEGHCNVTEFVRPVMLHDKYDWISCQLYVVGNCILCFPESRKMVVYVCVFSFFGGGILVLLCIFLVIVFNEK